MKRMIDNMKAWLQKKHEARQKRQAEKRAAAIARESERQVQTREFSGEIYLCVNDVPVMPADGLTWDLPTAVAVAREAYAKWRKKEVDHGER